MSQFLYILGGYRIHIVDQEFLKQSFILRKPNDTLRSRKDCLQKSNIPIFLPRDFLSLVIHTLKLGHKQDLFEFAEKFSYSRTSLTQTLPVLSFFDCDAVNSLPLMVLLKYRRLALTV